LPRGESASCGDRRGADRKARCHCEGCASDGEERKSKGQAAPPIGEHEQRGSDPGECRRNYLDH
jgi:hypothetical protein